MSRTRILALAGLLLALCAIFTIAQRHQSSLQQVRPRTVSRTNPNTIRVGARGDLQAAINAAQPGDTIILEAGASYTGAFVLPNKPGSGWITIQSSRLSELAEGVRVSPAQSPLMPRIVASVPAEPALSTEPGAHHYRFIGIEFARVNPSLVVYDLVRLGDDGAAQDALAKVPHHLTFDRCYIHGDTGDLKRGIALNSAHTDITNCYISEFHVVGQDTQAICGWNGPGPFRIINNYLEAAGENIMFGGAHPSIAGLVPSDIEIRRNHFYKPLAWRTTANWSVKNLFEIKNARRVILDGNVFENNWVHSQSGIGILLRGGSDSGRRAVCEDISFTNNIVRASGGAMAIVGLENPDQVDPGYGACRRITVRNNLFDDISWSYGGAAGFLLLADGPADVTIDHNTVLQQGSIITADGGIAARNFVFTNNLVAHNEYGIVGSGTAPGKGTLDQYFPGARIERNVLAGASASVYPANNFYPGSLDDARFVNRAAGNYRLAAGSTYKGRATEGRDVGCDVAALEAAIRNVASTPHQQMPAYEGYHDVADCSSIKGWAWNQSRPNTAVSVDIYDGSTRLATIVADSFRKDLVNAGKGSGYHGFIYPTPAALKDGRRHTIYIKFSGTNTDLQTTARPITCSASIQR